MTYRIYIRDHNGQITERCQPTDNPHEAETAYRRLLNRSDLVGSELSAVISLNGKTIYWSQYDIPEQQIHPSAPLEFVRTDNGTDDALEYEHIEFTLPDNPSPSDIVQARESLGLTQKQLTPLLGYNSVPRISEIENGARNPSDAVIRLLQAYLSGYRPPDWPR